MAFRVIVFDTETTGLPTGRRKGTHPDPSNPDNYRSARIVQMAWQHVDLISGKVLVEDSFISIPSGEWKMSKGAEDTHGISRERVETQGRPLLQCLESGGFWEALADSRQLVAHNIMFDFNVLLADLYQEGKVADPLAQKLKGIARHCTMHQTTEMCKLPFAGNAQSGQFRRAHV